tara:strand:+ start:233 stop:532 length:300 start_codon:yes stop_codon:yes gene_type:complete
MIVCIVNLRYPISLKLTNLSLSYLNSMAIIQKNIKPNYKDIFHQLKIDKMTVFALITYSFVILSAFIKNLLPLIALSLILAFIWRQASKMRMNNDQYFS